MKHHVHLPWQWSKDDLVFKAHPTDANATRWSEKKEKVRCAIQALGVTLAEGPKQVPVRERGKLALRRGSSVGCRRRIRENMAVPTWLSTWGSENFLGDSAVPPFLDPKWTSWKCTNLLRRWRGPSPWGAPHYLARTCCFQNKKRNNLHDKVAGEACLLIVGHIGRAHAPTDRLAIFLLPLVCLCHSFLQSSRPS